MNNSTKALYAIALLVVAGSIAFLAVKRTPISNPVAVQTAKPTPTITPTPATTPTAIPITIPSASPATSGTLYINTMFGYEFTYPNTVTIEDATDPRTPVLGTTPSVCVTQPGSGFCSLEVSMVTMNGPSMLTDSYVKSIYPKYNAQYDILSNTTLNGLSGIQVVNGGLRDVYIETSAGVVLDFFDGQNKYSAGIIPTIILTK